MRRLMMLLTLGTALAGNVQAEPLVLQAKNNNVSLSIYNRDLALVKDMRPADMKAGTEEVVFDGVAEQIQPETAMIYGQDIKVLEQNYSFNIMTNNNLIDQSVGQEVTTVRENPTTGEHIFEKATIIAATYGMPVLQFSYGIESNFPGRIVFNKLPVGVSEKPTLTAKINNKKAGSKNLYLAYLTGGLSWKTDYVATVTGKNTLDLNGWVTITNESGVDYDNAKIQLVAGDVNVVRNSIQPRNFRVQAKLMTAEAVAMDADAAGVPETVSSYEIYTLPAITSIKNKQTKQISLLEKNGVKFAKEFNLVSPLYFGSDNEFEKLHPEITYVMENRKDANLGISLPSGTVRFYENDKNGNLQFIGANSIGNTAKEETLRLKLGEAFNLSANGKITKMEEKEVSRVPQNSCFMVQTVKTYAVEISLNNAEKVENTVIVKQNFPENYKLVKESVKSQSRNVTTRQWLVKVPAEGKNTLSYTVDITQKQRLCQ